MDKRPKVSILMITYNHEDFIETAIRSIIKQLEIDFELIISDDCSTDKTPIIIRELLENEDCKEYVKFFKQDPNIGMIRNFLFALENCKGEYVAFCEGDDFWTDNLKLRKQINILDSNPAISATFHQTQVWDERKQIMSSDYFENWNISKVVDPNWIIEKGGGSFPSCSLVFRNFDTLPKAFFLNSPSADRPLSLLLLLKGEFYYHMENMGVYRLHQNGAMTGILNDPKRLLILHRKNQELLKTYLKICKKNHKTYVKNSISKQTKSILLIDKFNHFKNVFLIYYLNWTDLKFLLNQFLKRFKLLKSWLFLI
jgi:glycosyltransferase involved in cell wall biosynthesis